MKKILLVFTLAAIISTGTAYADHPENFGIGVVFDIGWGNNGLGIGGALALKFPKLPIFWALSLGGGHGHFYTGITGDWYFIDKVLADYSAGITGQIIGLMIHAMILI